MADPDGFADFVNGRYATLVRHGTLLTGDQGHGEDLTQDALVKTYRAWHRLHPHGDPDAYTRTVMIRAAWRAGQRLWRREIPTGELPERPAVVERSPPCVAPTARYHRHSSTPGPGNLNDPVASSSVRSST